MKVKLVAAIMLLAAVPVMAAAQDDQIPGTDQVPGTDEAPGTDDVPDPENVDGETPYEELFVPIRENPCPLADGFEAKLLDGTTPWKNATHPDAREDCVAQWGDGSFQRGSDAVLGAPPLSTRHVAASDAPGQALGGVAQTLVENGASPEVAARIVGSMTDGCRTYGENLATPPTDDLAGVPLAMDFCRKMLSSASTAIEVPESPVGIGALYFQLTHAYDFTPPDANQRADTGGWVEIRTAPDEPFKRLEPVALYSASNQGVGNLCAITGPPTLAVDALTRYDTPPAAGGQSLRDIYESSLGDPDNSRYGPAADAIQQLPVAPFSELPTSQEDWENSCAGRVQQVYGLEEKPLDQTDASQLTNPTLPPSEATRFNPYPGTIRGEGPGFVGATQDEGKLRFVDHWFDLSPYAGETVEIRVHATGGAGLGSEVGGWWIDEANVRYAGPADDLSVRVTQPESGDSLPPEIGTGQLPGIPVTAEIENLGRTESRPAEVELSLGDDSKTVSVPALAPLESTTVSAVLDVNGVGDTEAKATLRTPTPQQAPTQAPTDEAPEQSEGTQDAYADAYPENDQDRVPVTIESDKRATISVTDVTVEGSTAHVELEVENKGNSLATVPVNARIAPVDLSTRQPRSADAQPLGIVDTVTVPNGDDANSFGVSDPVATANTTVQLPADGVWQITFDGAAPSVQVDTARAVVPLNTATPTAAEDSLGRVNNGTPIPELDIPRGGFLLEDGDTSDDEVPAWIAEPRNPIEGPHTRFVPTGQASLATSGEEVPEEWTPVETEIGGGTAPTQTTRAPATLQGYHIRQHHVAIFSLGTDVGGDDAGDRPIDELIPENDDQTVELQFRHAADVNWSNEKGAKARAVVVPGGQIDLVEEMREMENRTENATEELPPEAQFIANQVNMGLFFDNVVQLVDSSPYTRFPQDVCSQTTVPLFKKYFRQICGDAQVLEEFQKGCPVDCELPEHGGSTYLRNSAEASSQGLVLEWEDPTGWEEVEADVTRIVENTTSPDPDEEHEGFYVMFDLVTTSDVDEVIASAKAETPGHGETYYDNANASARTGWEDSRDPRWTVDDPKLVRESQDEPLSLVCMSQGDNEDISPEISTCGDDDETVKAADLRGWRSLPAEAGVDPGWTYDLRGGDPDSPAPGAFVWEGGTGSVVETPEGPRTAIDEQGTDPYSVLSSPTVDLSGYDKPVVELNTKWTDVEVGSVTGESESISNRCENMRDAPSGTVWTRTGWNVRARPVLEDGSLGEAKTVTPVSGYDECSDVGSVPVLFNGTAVQRKPHSAQGSVSYEVLNTPSRSTVPSRASCEDVGNPDALQFCKQTTLQFGHAQPVFALPQPTWDTVAFDLSEFQNQEVRLEVHAFGVNTDKEDSDGEPISRGELRVDRFEIGEGAPPFDVDVRHEQRPFIAPGTDELFELEVTNKGSQPVESLTVRRSIVGPDGCQATDPVVVESILRDPDTSETGLPPGKTATLEDRRLTWEIPDQENEIYRRLLTADTGTLEPSEAPELNLQRALDSGAISVGVKDADDCADDLDLESTVVGGDADIDTDDLSVTVEQGNDLGEELTPSTVAVTATDVHGVESLPAYVTPLPPQETAVGEDPLAEPEEGAVNVEVVQSALDETGAGSVVHVEAVASEELAKIDLVLPCTTGPDCQGDVVEISGQGSLDAVVEGLAPGTYFGYVAVGGQEAPFPVRFTIEQEPDPGQDARPSDNKISLRGETKPIPRLTVGDVKAPTVAPLGEDIRIPIELENEGNVPLTGISAKIRIEPNGRQFDTEIRGVNRLNPGGSVQAETTAALRNSGPARLIVEATAQTPGGETVSDVVADGLLGVQPETLDPVAGNYGAWNVSDTIQLGDGNRVPAEVNETLPLSGSMDTGAAPLSFLNLNMSGSLEHAYDGVAVEWVGTAGKWKAFGAQGYPAQDYQLPERAEEQVARFVEERCNPTNDAVDRIGEARVSVSTLQDDFNCLDAPVGTQLTSSHEGGTPGETKRAITGSPTLGLPGVENMPTLTAASDLPNVSALPGTPDSDPPEAVVQNLPGVETRVVDRPVADDWADDGSFTVDLDADLISGDVFWMPTATNLDGQVQHRLRVPLTQGEWCELMETADDGEPLRLTTQERRLFGADAWDVNVRLETGELVNGNGRSLGAKQPAAERLTPVEDPSTTDWSTLEYEIALPSVVLDATPGEAFDPDYCENISVHRDNAPGKGHPTDLTLAQLVFELTATGSPNEEALDVGWFLDEATLEPLGVSITGDTSQHEAKRCFTPDGDERPVSKGKVPTPEDSSRSIQGCTAELTGGQRTGTLGHPTFSDLPSEEHLQRLSISGSSVTMANGDPIPVLENLQQKSEFEAVAADDESDNTDSVLYRTNDQDDNTYDAPVDEVLRAPVPDADDPERFRYMDTFTVTDLRSGFDAQLEIDVTATTTTNDGSKVDRTEDGDGSLGEHVVAQVVASPVNPNPEDEDVVGGEDAPARADWIPLELCEETDPDPVPPTQPDSPLGATEDSIIGPIQGPNTTLEDRDKLCADLSPVGGEIAVIGLRFWIPHPETGVEIGAGEVTVDVPTPGTLEPRLRALTDDTVHEGTLTINDVQLLSMPPTFSHTVDAGFSGTQEWTREDGWTVDVLVANGAPTLTVETEQPAAQADWTMDLRVNATYDPEDPDDEPWANGTVSLDRSTFEGSTTVEIPWQKLREEMDWLADAPSLPQNVTGLQVDVITEPQTLAESPANGCPADISELNDTRDPECRRLADPISDDDRITVSLPTEANRSALPGGPGPRDAQVTPDRAPSGTDRTLTVELANPSSRPAEFNGTLEVQTPYGHRVWGTEIAHTVVQPWARDTIEIDIPGQDLARTRLVAEVELGDQSVTADYRTTTIHPSRMLDENDFEGGDGVERTPDAARPPLAGQTSDGVGWRIESSGSVRDATVLKTDTIWSGDLREMLRDTGTNPVLTFQHQADLRDAVNGDPGDTSYLAVSICEAGGDECNLLETGWNPEPPQMRPTSQGAYVPPGSTEPVPYDRCTENQDEAEESLVREGIQPGRDGTDRVFRSSTGPIQPDTLTAWETAVVPIDDPDVIDWWRVEFHIWLGECTAKGPSEVLIDDVELGSARPVLDIGADEVPIWPGSEKRYRFTLSNEGGGSADVQVAPSAQIPDGWRVKASVNGTTVFQTGETPVPVPLAVGETKEGVLRVQAPSDAQRGAQPVSLTAYVADAPGLQSSGAINASIVQDDENPNREDWDEDPSISVDPGALTVNPVDEDLPNLRVEPPSVSVEDAEIGRETKIQVDIVNEGTDRAVDVPIVASVQGPSGFATLETATGQKVAREEIAPGASTTVTYTWKPLEPGEHRLRVVADPEPGADALLVKEDVRRFFGLVQESSECDPAATCPNILDHSFEVAPLQQPDLRLSVDGVPDRISIGDERELAVTVENVGGRTATDAELTLSENGLLPIFDDLTVELPELEPGAQETLRTTWAPVSPGEGLVLGSVDAPDAFTGTLPDGTDAGAAAEVAIPVTIDRAEVAVELEEPIRTQPGTSHVVNATFINDGTMPVTVQPDHTRRDGVLLRPALDAPLEVGAGEEVALPMLGFAEIGTPPKTVEMPVPTDEAATTVPVRVVPAPDARVTLDERPLAPGTHELPARVVNEGNVPLDGTLEVRGPGIEGTVDVSVDVGETANATVPVTVSSGATPGTVTVATHLSTEDDRATQTHRLHVEGAPAVDVGLRADEAPLTGSATGELVVRNVGNEPVDGRLALDGPVSLAGDAAIDLEPGQTALRDVTWITATNRTGEIRVETLDGDLVGSASLDPGEAVPGLELRDVQTRPSVNLQEGMEVEVVATVQNTGNATLDDHTLGITVDGELYQTFEVGELKPGETTATAGAIALPDAGELTIGVVDLAAFQRGETAGAATTVEVAESSFGFDTVQAIPTVPWAGILGALALAAGVTRR